MANDVVLGAAMRSNLLSLQNTQRSIDNTQLRLATGKKVNSALDNPQSFFQAQSLNNRASDLTRLLDGIGQSIRTIEEADKGITALTRLVEQASSVADEAAAEIRAAEGLATITGTKDLRNVADLEAASSGAIVAGASDQFTITIQDADILSGAPQTSGTLTVAGNVYSVAAAINADAAIQDYVRASVDSSGRLKLESIEEGASIRVSSAGNAMTSAGWEYLGLSDYVRGEANGAGGTITQGGTVLTGRVLKSDAIPVGQINATTNLYEASTTLGDAGFLTAASDATLTITIDGEAVPLANLTDTSTVQELVDEINNSGNDKVSARFNTKDGTVEIVFADDVGKVDLSYTSTAGTTLGFNFGGSGATGAVAAGEFASEGFTLVGSSANLDQYTKDFNKLRAQIDGIVQDANYRGVNLLGGDNLTTFFNEDRSNKLITEGIDLTVVGMGIDKANFIDAASIEKSLNQVRDALDGIRAFGASIANDLSIIQTRRDFTEQTINTLKAGASDLTDADLNEEGANLLALQTAQQLGVTSLSLASQSQQSVLRLF